MNIRTGNQFAQAIGHDPTADGGEIDAVTDSVHGATLFIEPCFNGQDISINAETQQREGWRKPKPSPARIAQVFHLAGSYP